jgi:hypothetical protein
MDKFEQAARDGDLSNSIAEARDMLRPIITGEIERQHCVGNQACYGGKPGFRKTKLTDAVKIAKQVEILLNRAINKFLDDE